MPVINKVFMPWRRSRKSRSVSVKQSYLFLLSTMKSCFSLRPGMISVPGDPARLCRSTFFLEALGSSARVRQNGLVRISITSRYDVTR